MNPLTISIPVNFPPLCPACLQPLLGQAVHIYGCVAFCSRCVAATQLTLLNRIVTRSYSSQFAELFTTSCGILVLAPKRTTRLSLLRGLLEYRCHDEDVDGNCLVGVIPDSCFDRSLPGS